MIFNPKDLKRLYKPLKNSNGEDNGQVTIIGGSSLFHGAPLLSLTAASRLVDMVFFASPEGEVGEIAAKMKSKLFSFVWIPWKEVEHYIEKSDAVLIGPGFMSFRSEKDRTIVRETKKITEHLLQKFPNKKWVIDAGSLQTMDAKYIPANAILTPNKREFQKIFNTTFPSMNMKEIMKTVEIMAKRHKCIIVYKSAVSIVSDGNTTYLVNGGNPGLTKGGTGDVQAGLTAALLAKNEPLLAATSAAYVIKAAADELAKTKGIYYNSDDLATKIPEMLNKVIK